MPALPRASGRRPRRRSSQRPTSARLYRFGLAGALLVTLFASFAVSRHDPLLAPPPPVFDGAAALALAQELSTRFPGRAPGTANAKNATDWVASRLEILGYTVRRDRFSAVVPGRGEVPLENLVASARGRSGRTIVLLAARDDVGEGPGANVNASGTAALLELARLYGAPARAEGGGALTPTHTLLLLSADGGAFGSLGADRFAARPRTRGRILAVVNLAALGGPGRPRLDVAGGTHSPAVALVATAAARVQDVTGRAARHTSIAGQLLDLAFPFSFYDHAPFLERRIPALTLTTAGVRPPEPFGDGPETLSALRLSQLGSSAQAIVDSLDQGLELESGPSSYVYLGPRTLAGWAVELALLAFAIPFGLALGVLLVRCWREAVPFIPALRSQLRRVGFWLFVGAVFWAFAAGGVWAEGEPRPISPYSAAAGDWPALAVGAFLAIVIAGWLVARPRLAGPGAEPEHELAGYAVALLLVGATAATIAVANPYALIFVLPSLHAWIWLPRLRTARAWLRATALGAGFLGPLILLASLAVRFSLGLDAPWYLAQLVAVGYIPPRAVLIALLWLAGAAQLSALVAGRYAPYPSRTARRRHGVVALARRLHTPGA